MRKLLAFLLFVPGLFAAYTPVSISSLARSGNVVTVTTATAHTLTANQGFCLAGVTLDASFNGCSTIASITSATVFTYNQQGAASSIGAGGTVTAAKQLIVLTVDAQSQPGYMLVNYLCWLTTTNPIPIGQGSVWTATNTNGSTAGSGGASTAESNAIKAGTTVERQHSEVFPNGTSTATMQGILQTACQKDQANLSAATQPATYYGNFYDGVGWGVQ